MVGEGLGRATNSARFFGQTRLITIYPAHLIYEMGIPGLVAMLGLYTTLGIAAFRAYRLVESLQLRKTALTLWLFVIFISFFPYLYSLNTLPAMVYYWLGVGIVLRLPDLDNGQRSGHT